MSFDQQNPARDALHDALETLTQTLSPSKFPTSENWQIGYGPAVRAYARSPYWEHMDSHDFPSREENQTTVIRLLYSPTGRTVQSDWISHMNYVAVRFGRDWDPEYNRDGDYDAVIPSSEAGPKKSARVAEKYMIGGPLCDPVVTGDVEVATEAAYDQFQRVEAGTQLNHIFEVFTAAGAYSFTHDEEDLPEIEDLPINLFDEDVETSSPIRSVSGIGDKTIKRFASRFAVYPNLLNAERGDFSGLLPGWSNSPDLDAMNDVIDTLTKHYQNLSSCPSWLGPAIDPEKFVGYPVGNPTYHGTV